MIGQINGRMLIRSKNIALAIVLFISLDRFSCYLTDHFISCFGDGWLILHHATQLILVLGIMLLPVWKRTLKQWGLNCDNHLETFRLVRSFTIGWIVCTTVFILISQMLSGWAPLVNYELTPINIFYNLFFEFIIVGISEELVFRGLVLGILGKTFKKRIKILQVSISVAGLITAGLFAAAHIGFSLSPLRITYFDPMQIIVAFSLSIFYAVMYEKTGSLLGPILGHNIADGWLSVLYILISFCIKQS